MRNLTLLICFSLIIFLKKNYAQISACSEDSVQFNLTGTYIGNIQWQKSFDLINWYDITGAIDTIFESTIDSTQYFRAFVSGDSTCANYYSDTVKVDAQPWNANLAVSNIDSQIVGTNTFYSSSKLLVRWNEPFATPNYYIITATDTIQNTSVYFESSPPSYNLIDTITGLKSSTYYTITIKACMDSACTNYIQCNGNIASTITDEEYWQLQGVGDSVNGITKVVYDGNVLSYAFVYGTWGTYPGKIRYYYSSANGAEKGVKPTLSNSVPANGNIASVMSFTGIPGYGFSVDSYQSGYNMFVQIGQASAIPYDGKIRLFLEAETDDHKNRIYYVDSKDGYLGVDFDSNSSSTSCSSTSDYIFGGGCEYLTALGIEGDSLYSNAHVTAIRQFKIGYPTFTNWLWEGRNGTFMTPTFDFSSTDSACGDVYAFTTGYALWDSLSAEWKLQYDSSGCPKFFDGLQAPSIVHVGNGNYRLYFNYNQTLKGDPHSPKTDTKPMKVIYAYGNDYPEFEDWEAITQARDLNYLWPDGALLIESEESKLDDYHFFFPTNDLDFMVMYTNISTQTSSSVIGAAILLNP
jgi:hypothetical protein